MRAWIVVLLLAGCAAPADETVQEVERGLIRGVVVDSAVVPVEGAHVALLGVGNATTDADGAFAFEVTPGWYQIRVTAPGFFDQQVAVTVEDEALVKFSLDRDISDVAFVEAIQFDGFMGWGFTVNTARGAGGDLTGDGDNGVRMFFPRLPAFFQTELVWESTQAMGNGMELTYIVLDEPNGTTGTDFERVRGSSPIHMGHEQTVFAENGVGGDMPLDVTTFSAPDGDIPLSLTVEQPFTLFMHAYYGQVPSEGWTFLADGSP